MRVWEVVCLKRQEYKSKNIIQGHYVDKIAPKLSLWTNSCPFYVIQISVIDVREGASGASADAPGVGLEMVSGLKITTKI